MPSSGPLPPSVEKAYYRKCIELRRRITEIEEHNDTARLRIKRLNRSILKMRLERAFLLEQLQQRMDYNVDDSDRSTSPPPTPQEKPLRAKRSHRKTTPTNSQAGPSSLHANSPPPSSHTGPQLGLQNLPMAMSSAHSTPDPGRTGIFFAGSPTSNANGTAGAVQMSRTASGAGNSAIGPPPPQPQFTSAPEGEEEQKTQTTQENGTEPSATAPSNSETAEEAPAAAAAAATEEKPEANGDSADANGGDTEMADAPDQGAFTAVNR